MPYNRARSKALKRGRPDDEGGSSKRSRLEEAPQAFQEAPPETSQKANPETLQKTCRKDGSKNFAARRLESLRNNIKSAANRLKKPFKTADTPKKPTNQSFRTVSEARSEADTLTPINQRLSRISSCKTLTPPYERSATGGVQARLKRNLKSQYDADDNSIIVIDDSPLPKPKTASNNNTLSPTSIFGANKVSPRAGSSKLADRLTKIRNAKSSSPKKELIPQCSENIETLPSLSSCEIVQKWMDSVHSRSSPKNETLSDSLTVNLDETVFNKSELLTESQGEDSMEWDAVSVPERTVEKKPAEVPPNEIILQKEKITCIVTDTNILMHDLSKVKELLSFSDTDNQKLKIYVPWMVFQELDYHKDNRAQPASSLALTAQKFINKQLLQPNSRIIGQSIQDVCQQMDVGKSPDDKIFACCLQAREKFESVILLSNDVNLCNKALTNGFKAYNAKEMLSRLKSSKFLKIKVKLQVPLSQIIFHCCKEAFGDVCTKMDMLQGSPWSFEGCLKRFKKYWNTVFRSLLLKQALKIVEELTSYANKGNISDPKELNKFKEKVKEFLFYLQDIEQFSGSIKKVQEEIDGITDSAFLL